MKIWIERIPDYSDFYLHFKEPTHVDGESWVSDGQELHLYPLNDAHNELLKKHIPAGQVAEFDLSQLWESA